jgi:hypothetical protein
MRLTEHDTDPNDTDVYFDRNLHANHIRSIDGSFELQDSSPEIQFIETDQSYSDWRYKVQVNNDIFRIETSRDGSGSTDPTTPMRLFAGAASTSDWVEFSNQVRAVEYCDEDGNNCADPALDFGGGGGPACTYRLYSYDRTSACAITPSVPSCGLGAARTSNVQSESVGCTGSETRNRIRCTLLECC